MSLALFPMLVVERLTGLTRRQIRYYEDKGLLQPTRTPGRHRLYSPEEVELLLQIKEHREQGFYSLNVVKKALERPKKNQAVSHRITTEARVTESDAVSYFERLRRITPNARN